MFPPNFNFFGSAFKASMDSSIEDVEYTEVKKDEQKQPSPAYDKAARPKEVKAAANNHFKDLDIKDPLIEVVLGGMFMAGAAWADELSDAVKGNAHAFSEAMGGEIDKILEGRKQYADKTGSIPDPAISLLVSTSFAVGAHWARENPPVKKPEPGIDKDFKTWAGSVFSSPVDFHIDNYGRVHVTSNQKIFAAIHRKNAQSLIAMAEDIIVNEEGVIVIIISEENSKPLINH